MYNLIGCVIKQLNITIMKKKQGRSSIHEKKSLSMSEKIIKQSTHAPESKIQITGSKHAKINSEIHCPPPKDYRIDQQDVYNYVRNSIYETFRPKTSRNYELMREYIVTQSPQQNLVIDRLCQKYSILRRNRRNCFENADINIEEITNRYVKSKSKQKQKEQEKARLKRDISLNYRCGPNRQYRKSEQFFSFEGNHLKNFEKMSETAMTRHSSQSQKKDQKVEKKHPYLEIYEKAQMQALSSLLNKEKLNVAPQFNVLEEQEEEKDKKYVKVQKVLSQAKNFKRRQIQSAREKSSNRSNHNFFLS